MKKLYNFLILFLMTSFGFSQVGINTTMPNAQLEIKSSSELTPTNTDGILIPKIDAFPLINPTVAQQSMMVYLTTTSAGKPPGFYYWDNVTTSWKGFDGTSDHDFYEVATTTPPDAITDNMFHTGNVGIGNVNPIYKLDVDETALGKIYAMRVRHSNAIDGSTTSSIQSSISGSFPTGAIQGISTFITPGLGTNATGLRNFVGGNSTASVCGVENSIITSGSGSRTGFYNGISGSGTGISYGMLNIFSNPNAVFLGVKSIFSASGIKNKIGMDNEISNSTGGFHTGVSNTFTNNNGAVEETGVFSKFTGSSPGNIRGIYNEITNSDAGNVHYGLYNNINGSGGLQRYGVENILSGTSSSEEFGVDNYISTSGGNKTHHGVRNYLSGLGTGYRIGTNNWISGSGSGDQYGVNNYIDNSGTGDKYGIYNYIPPATNGLHYGVYSNVTKVNSYAGYFLGRMAIGTTVANNYILPLTRGTVNQMMQTDATGNVTWQNPNIALNGFAWTTTGNTGTNPATNFIGTTDDIDLVFKRFNINSGRISITQTALGLNALNPLNTGVSNSAFGGRTLENNTSGEYNTAIGQETLRNNTTGSGNTGVGGGALLSNNTGSLNVAYGGAALVTNSTGNYNTGVGVYALANSLSGGLNTAVGAQANARNYDGNNNTSIGVNCMYNNQSGSNATAIGYEAMFSTNGNLLPFINKSVAVGFQALRGVGPSTANTGNSNTAIGYQSINKNSTGSFNSALGDGTLFENKTGNNNTAVGYSALKTNNSGSNNTVLGHEAGNLNISGSGNIILGYQAGFNETASNKLYIENSNSVTPLIYGEFDNDLLKINGNIKVDNITTIGNEMQIVNKNNYTHFIGNQIFGIGGDDFIISSEEGASESGGMYADGNAVSIWSPGDANQSQPQALVYFLDEDFFDATNTNPYDNTALKSYITPVGAYVQISDKNKKENIVKIENATEKINQISGYTYQFKLNPEEVKKGDKPIQSSGVLAQEVEKILPQAVQKNQNGDYFVDYAAITPLLIEAIKEQNTKIKVLETMNAEILMRLTKLENK